MQTIVYGLCSVITNNQPMGGYKQSYLTVASGTHDNANRLGDAALLADDAAHIGLGHLEVVDNSADVYKRQDLELAGGRGVGPQLGPQPGSLRQGRQPDADGLGL